MAHVNCVLFSAEQELRHFVTEYLVEEPSELLPLDEMIMAAKENLRMVGPISWLERRAKVEKFKRKKCRRFWREKISYDCRKKVADNRLRVKGKFVTKEQACELLGVEETSEDNLREMLALRYVPHSQ